MLCHVLRQSRAQRAIKRFAALGRHIQALIKTGQRNAQLGLAAGAKRGQRRKGWARGAQIGVHQLAIGDVYDDIRAAGMKADQCGFFGAAGGKCGAAAAGGGRCEHGRQIGL